MATSINSINERFSQISETLRLAIIVSIFWPIFSFIYIVEPNQYFILSEFIRKFVLMGVLPLGCSWGLWWVIRGFMVEKRLK